MPLHLYRYMYGRSIRLISSQGGSDCFNSIRVILFWQSAILSGNMLYRRHTDAHVYMYIPQAREHYTSSVLGDRSHHSGMHAVSDTH